MADLSQTMNLFSLLGAPIVNRLKAKRLNAEENESVTNCHQLKILARDG
ncbi:hypothetical protein PQO03_06720 [Lentisphaera profundi]|uniref:Uncharacterized protein n=1 Tax=Lentisphaera profundi TaxID=1658616 RepID=A0ABY7VRJ9_9BACT|nr:hypothetical protein [Lentisphaera profundi]WDE95409.1 hypothetical protein PQO03_06720 [Lentisphaera profundi]